MITIKVTDCTVYRIFNKLLSSGWLVVVTAAGSLNQAAALPITLNTGSGDVVISQTLQYQSSASAWLSLDFGFATSETVAPSQFYDSFTVSVSGPGGVAYLVTADASGLLWAPFVPGSVSVPDFALERQATSFLAPTQGEQPIGSYELHFALPTNWVGVPLTIEFDLFDNQNRDPSLGYYAVAVVPEPADTVWLLLITTASCLWFRKR